MDGWMNRWMDGWIDLDGWIDGLMKLLCGGFIVFEIIMYMHSVFVVV